MNYSKSEKLFEEAKKYIPGGVNSPVRAFNSVGGTPLFIERGEGSRIYDADGNPIAIDSSLTKSTSTGGYMYYDSDETLVASYNAANDNKQHRYFLGFGQQPDVFYHLHCGVYLRPQKRAP